MAARSRASSVLRREGLVDEQDRHGRKIERIERPQQPCGPGHLDRARIGQFDPGGQAQQAALSGAVLSDDADHHAIGRGGVELPQRRAGHAAKRKSHKR